jgi:hypothetical protein
LSQKPVFAFDALSVGMSLGTVNFLCDDDAVVGAALAGRPDLRARRQQGIEPALLAGNHLRLIFSRYRIETAIHAGCRIDLLRPASRSSLASVRGRVASLKVRGGRHFVVVESATVDHDGEVVSVEQNTLVVPATSGGQA